MSKKETQLRKKLEHAGRAKQTLVAGSICLDCLKLYKQTREGKTARLTRLTGGEWGKGRWPASCWSDCKGPRCLYHAGLRRSETAKRRAAEIQATPKWADPKLIQQVYDLAAKTEQESGVPHHVDHVVPLRGKNVCGLHVHYNLAVMTAKANKEKSNRFA
ncbi:TPA: hypothetical protein ACSPMB_000091 [Pseudomonas aeruginosa]